MADCQVDLAPEESEWTKEKEVKDNNKTLWKTKSFKKRRNERRRPYDRM